MPRWDVSTTKCLPTGDGPALCTEPDDSEWTEQFGRMLTEAMACGVPVLATNRGKPHVVDDAGVLIPG
jgi:glycosyltransferase involved in cell wall biosynthesis